MTTTQQQNTTDDLGIISQDPLIPPQILQLEIKLDEKSISTISTARQELASVISNNDDRLIVIVGPCSIHDYDLAIEYAKKLQELNAELKSDLVIVMRTYFEKPRTTVGWKGLINDPEIDGSFQINKGLRLARKLLIEINKMGLPVAVELLDTISPQLYY